VTVAPTNGAISGWTVNVTLPSGHQITNSWNATVTTTGQAVSARNLSHNGSLSGSQTAGWGFQASRSAATLPTNFTCTAS
jgi:cellulase/cellobiase CelA1